MKNNKKKTNHSSSFGRLWSYLQAYRFPLYLAIFLKIVSVIMSVLEPVVIGLAITELTKNTLAIIKGVEGAHINVSYVGWVLVVHLITHILNRCLHSIGHEIVGIVGGQLINKTTQEINN